MIEVRAFKLPGFALPITGSTVPHDVKHDGCRLMLIREGERVQLISLAAFVRD